MSTQAIKRDKYKTLTRIKNLISGSPAIPKCKESLVFALCACLVILTMNASAGELESLTVPGLEKFLVATEFQLPLSRKIYVAEPRVSFAKDWLRLFTSETTRAYRASIKKKYGETLRKELRKALKDAGWEISGKPGDNIIKLNADLIDLYINQPEKITVREVLITTVGKAGIELLFQTSDAQLFMQMIDHRNTRGVVLGTVLANRGTNHRYFKMLMSDWSTLAAFYLNELITVAESQAKKQTSQ